MLARTEAVVVGTAHSATCVAATRLAHAGVVVAAATLPITADGPQYALAVSILALGVARAAGVAVPRRPALELPIALAVGANLAALAIALLAGGPWPLLESATRFRAYLAPVVVAAALSLPLPGDGPDAPRERAVRALLAWCLAALLASLVGIIQGAAGIDPLFALGLRRIERLPPVPGWPGHFAATGFYSGYARFGQHLLAPLLLAAALALSGGVRGRRRLLLVSTAAAASAAVIFTALRTGWVSLAAGILALAALGGRPARRVALPLVGLGTALALLHPGLRLRLAALLAGEGNGDRRTIWAICGVIREDHPLGIGPGVFEHLAPGYWARLAPGTAVMPGCHSAPLELLVEGGPMLLLASGVAVALVVRAFWRARAAAPDALARAAAVGALATVAALAPSALFHDLHRAVQVVSSVGVVLGLAAVLALPLKGRPRRPRGCPRRGPARPRAARGRAGEALSGAFARPDPSARLRAPWTS